ncbi:MAG: substrate-binding domain-containing protein [Saprospiraceae bacterium]|nr:substrate-binding domain-containing protein [Saprospiraceae bacterium]
MNELFRYMLKIIFNPRFIALLAMLITSCKDLSESSPTIGKTKIACDIQIKDLMLQQEAIFEQRYKYADLTLEFFNERDLMQLWLADSFRNVIIGRPLDSLEIRHFKVNQQVSPRHFPFAVGAIALLTHQNNRDSSLTYEDFLDLCAGRKNDNVRYSTLVIEDSGSGVALYILDLLKSEKFTGSVYALNTKMAIIDYLKKNPNAIAAVDWAEFSDSDDSQKKSLLNGLQRLAISRPLDSLQYGFLLPDQYNLQDKRYPLQRTWQFISCSGKSDLALGFASFVAGEIGQKIVLKAGMLPIFQTERWIEFTNGDYKIVN